ncbi:MAG: transketolase C-terminal domain-containing protein [Armatimonadota bacterium]|nr:transketolase C-terminal domain-containing protein [Armatimonadota bacterium]MDR5702112.1 transketolase C-terminal domain-containing protein [Armatimonadota bacterium]MDR7434159.1 transketolase C-terminal domain-containing protein [Armatimonadota bacterium]
MWTVLEGSVAIAEAVRRCRPRVISAYPITPQTHIVEHLARLAADGELDAEVVNVESEHSAASVVLGAVATGVRAYTATSSQGLLLMAEVLYNIAGLRLPVVLTCANRAVSSPINIWNDHQDAMAVRDSGWIQLFAEDNQEAVDLHIQAYRIAELTRLPVMVNVDGFVLTHAYEPVDLPDQEEVDAFLPPFEPKVRLDPDHPLTLGMLAEPHVYMEARYALNEAVLGSKEVILQVQREFQERFGRSSGGLISVDAPEDAEIVFVAMGSVLGTIREAAESLRHRGIRAGVLKVTCFRPFPGEAIASALRGTPRFIVLEKALSMGSGGILANEMRAAFYERDRRAEIISVIAGLGGRDVTVAQIEEVAQAVLQGERGPVFLGLDQRLLAREGTS